MREQLESRTHTIALKKKDTKLTFMKKILLFFLLKFY